MRTDLLGLFLLVGSSALAAEAWQSRFVGPNSLKVWQHWQASQNVDATGSKHEFELIRFFGAKGPVVQLTHSGLRGAGQKATLRCESWVRKSEWEVESRAGEVRVAVAEPGETNLAVWWTGATECLDRSDKNLTRSLEVRIEDASGKEVFSETFLPMYVRGKNASYWNNRIPPYSAHAGKGVISVATLMAGEKDWDRWDGILVKPIIEFMDRNTMNKGAEIGLHRHVANQEAYLVEDGVGEMAMGVATRSGDIYKAERLFWEENGERQKVDEFVATGGYVEFRNLSPGDIAVIVPDAAKKDRVYFHGIRAVSSDLVFWTMGKKN